MPTGQWSLACHQGASTRYHPCATSHPHWEFPAWGTINRGIICEFLSVMTTELGRDLSKVTDICVLWKIVGSQKILQYWLKSMHALQSLSWVQMQYHVFITFPPQGNPQWAKKTVGEENQKREEKTETFESRLCSSLWRLLDRVHKFPPVGMVCPLKYTPSPGHPQALPLWNQNQCTRRSFLFLFF